MACTSSRRRQYLDYVKEIQSIISKNASGATTMLPTVQI
jgi:hypothetical protein